jgi:hypothetical protein
MRGFERIMPKLLPYDADDDEAAEQYVREAPVRRVAAVGEGEGDM